MRILVTGVKSRSVCHFLSVCLTLCTFHCRRARICALVRGTELAGERTMDGHLWEVNEWITGCPGRMLDSSHPRNAEMGKCLSEIN